jgi:hypothetical protein
LINEVLRVSISGPSLEESTEWDNNIGLLGEGVLLSSPHTMNE